MSLLIIFRSFGLLEPEDPTTFTGFFSRLWTRHVSYEHPQIRHNDLTLIRFCVENLLQSCLYILSARTGRQSHSLTTQQHNRSPRKVSLPHERGRCQINFSASEWKQVDRDSAEGHLCSLWIQNMKCLCVKGGSAWLVMICSGLADVKYWQHAC